MSMATRSGKAYHQETKGSRRRNVIKDTGTSPNAKCTDDNLDVSSISNKDVRSRRSSIKNSTFDKSNVSIKKSSIDSATDSNWIISDLTVKKNKRQSHSNENAITENMKSVNKAPKQLRKKKLHVADSTFDKTDEAINTTYEKIAEKVCEIDSVRDAIEKDTKAIKNTASVMNTNDIEDTENDLNTLNIGKALAKKKKKGKASKKKKQKEKQKESIEESPSDNVNIVDTTFEKDVVARDASIGNNFDLNISKTQKHLNTSNVSNKSSRNRKSNVIDTTFEKDVVRDASIGNNVDLNISKTNEQKYMNTSNVSNKSSRNRKSNVIDTTFEKDVVVRDASIGNNVDLNISKTNEQKHLNTSNVSNKSSRNRKSNVIDTTFEKQDTPIDTTFDKDDEIDRTFDKNIDCEVIGMTKGNGRLRNSSVRLSSNKNDKTNETSASFDTFKKGAKLRKSSITDSSLNKFNISIHNIFQEKDKVTLPSPANKRMSLRRRTIDISPTPGLNTTFEKTSNADVKSTPRRSIVPVTEKLNTTFDKEDSKNSDHDSKSSLISSDNSNVSRVSITSDDSVENIINATPVLIESSIDETYVQDSPKKTPEKLPMIQTPLKREGTFTKDAPEVTSPHTPGKRESIIPAAGCTPYHVSKSSQKKAMLNVTRSIEKRLTVDPEQRMTRVMFCSPIDHPATVAQEKRKVIKSNLKGSNKSFVFDENTSIPRPARKRSYTQNDADTERAKRTRLTDDLQHSVDRLSRPRTGSSTAKPTETTPKKSNTPYKSKSESKPSRTRLPNFAALHQKQFAKMESLGECQERKARRARQMLTPTAPTNVLDRISPKNNTEPQKPTTKEPVKPKDKSDTPSKKPPTLDSRPGFTRFGFKLNLDVNPFSIPSKTDKPKLNGVVSKPGPLPSLTGTTSSRRVAAQQTVMREKTLQEKRKTSRSENRTIIKGVRTNRRFELQMKLRNVD